MKRMFIYALLVLLATQSLVALGQVENQPDAITTITWWHPNSGLAGKAAEALVAEFNNTVGKEKNIQVQAVYQGKANDVLTKAKAMVLPSLISVILPTLSPWRIWQRRTALTFLRSWKRHDSRSRTSKR